MNRLVVEAARRGVQENIESVRRIADDIYRVPVKYQARWLWCLEETGKVVIANTRLWTTYNTLLKLLAQANQAPVHLEKRLRTPEGKGLPA
jgi:hypothetical protein